MINKTIKRTAKKVFKSGFFNIIHISENAISFKNCFDLVFSFQIDEKSKIENSGLFRAGYVQKWTEHGPTFESDFKSIGPIEKAFFKCRYAQHTDNPDFIIRQALIETGIN